MKALEHHQSILEVRTSMWSSMPTPNQPLMSGTPTQTKQK